MRIVALPARHQRRALREGIEQQLAVMVGVERVVRLDHGDELDRDEERALVEQLEHGMLGVGADAAPGDRRGRCPTGEPSSVTDLPFDSISSCWR